jgi:hypothetical protein
MNTDYDKWDKFDVDGEVQRLESEAKAQDAKDSKDNHVAKFTKVEEKAAAHATLTAAALKSKAAVEALKAKRANRKIKTRSVDPLSKLAPDTLQAGAEVAGSRAKALAAAYTFRERAKTLLSAGMVAPARDMFSAALEQVRATQNIPRH